MFVIIYSTNSVSHKEFFMKNVLKAFGIIAIVAVIGFSMVACGDSGGSGGGSGLVGGIWQETTTLVVTISFTATRFEYKIGGNVAYTGTYEFDPSTGTGTLHYEETGVDLPFTLSDGILHTNNASFRKK
jgi:hypothetical protein